VSLTREGACVAAGEDLDDDVRATAERGVPPPHRPYMFLRIPKCSYALP
jgi:hypothetical protein